MKTIRYFNFYVQKKMHQIGVKQDVKIDLETFHVSLESFFDMNKSLILICLHSHLSETKTLLMRNEGGGVSQE